MGTISQLRPMNSQNSRSVAPRQGHCRYPIIERWSATREAQALLT